jgi:signal transduction histidine kinase
MARPSQGDTLGASARGLDRIGRSDDRHIGRSAEPQRRPGTYPVAVFSDPGWHAQLARIVRPMATLAVASLLIIDATVGRQVLHEHQYATAAGVIVLAVVAVRARHHAVAAAVAASGSIAISVIVAGAHLTVRSRFVDAGAWPGLAEAVGLAILAAYTARWSRPPAAVAGVLSVAGSLVSMSLVRYDGPYQGILTALLLAGGAVVVGAAVYVRLLETGRRAETHRARQDERLALARELHDVVAHHVTGIVVQAQAARLVAETRPDAVEPALVAIEQAGSDAMRAMRNLVGSLRDDAGPAPTAPTAGLGEVRELATRSASMGLPVRLHADGVESLAGEHAASVHRIVQEAITNTRRHARGATRIDVWIAERDDELWVVVADDGEPRRPGSWRAGYGLTGMAERTHALGGRFFAGPHRDRGWVVQARLPSPTRYVAT